MPLEFHGVAIADPAERNVRFAGYPVKGKSGSLVICEITAEALRLLESRESNLAAIFESHRAIICKIASSKFDEGLLRPRLTKDDVLEALDTSVRLCAGHSRHEAGGS
jgi:hypothetical protein